MYDVAHEHAYKMYFSYLTQIIENQNTVSQFFQSTVREGRRQKSDWRTYEHLTHITSQCRVSYLNQTAGEGGKKVKRESVWSRLGRVVVDSIQLPVNIVPSRESWTLITFDSRAMLILWF